MTTKNMIRKIVDYSKLNDEILDLLVEEFPNGYDESDVITFRNAKNEVIEAVEVRTEDTIYLVKVGKRLVQAMEEFSEDNDTNDEDDADYRSGQEQNGQDAEFAFQGLFQGRAVVLVAGHEIAGAGDGVGPV